MKPVTDRRSRQCFVEFKSNRVMANQKLISQETTEVADADIRSINTEDAAMFSRKLTKEELFKLLYSKNYEKEPSPNRYRGNSKPRGGISKVLLSANLSNNKLPIVKKGHTDSQTNLAVIQEDKHNKFGNTMSFLNNGNKAGIAMPPKRKTSYELLNEVFSKTKYNNFNVPSLLSPSTSNEFGVYEKMIDSSKQGNKTIKAIQNKNVSCMNENGLLKVILNKIEKSKQNKLKASLNKLG